MILSDKDIKEAISNGDIDISPFDEKSLGCNSYDVHLGEILLTYDFSSNSEYVLDCKKDNPTIEHKIGPDGFKLVPGELYLGVTQEHTITRKHVPVLEGKSSGARLGISIHATAGVGDVAFKGRWTLEISVIHPVIVYTGMPIGQLIYFDIGEVETDYSAKKTAKYNNYDLKPQPSKMWMNFPLKK